MTARPELVEAVVPNVDAPVDRHAIRGGDFAFSVEAEIPAVWGRADEVLAASGEYTLVVSPIGVGKTTLALRFARARIGVDPSDFLSFPVERASEPVLYVAADRPAQIRRAYRRMCAPEERSLLDEGLVFYSKRPPFDICQNPDALLPWVQTFGATTLVLDSLKDCGLDIAKPETGARAARALSDTANAGIDVIVLHHHRKGAKGDGRPDKIDDVYGAQQIASSAGSVLLLWGAPGDPFVDLSHIRAPASNVGPLRLSIDHTTGELAVREGTDLLAILRAASEGIAAKDAARALFATTSPTAGDTEKARRKLDSLVLQKLAYRRDAEARRGAVKSPAVYFATPDQGVLV